MSLATNVQDQIRRFVVGLVSADDLSDWLDAHAQAIHDAGDDQLRRLVDTAFSLLEDIQQGHRCEEDVQTLLSHEVHMAVGFSGFLRSSEGTVAIVTGTLTDVPVTGTSTAFTLSELIVVAPPVGLPSSSLYTRLDMAPA